MERGRRGLSLTVGRAVGCIHPPGMGPTWRPGWALVPQVSHGLWAAGGGGGAGRRAKLLAPVTPEQFSREGTREPQQAPGSGCQTVACGLLRQAGRGTNACQGRGPCKAVHLVFIPLASGLEQSLPARSPSPTQASLDGCRAGSLPSTAQPRPFAQALDENLTVAQHTTLVLTLLHGLCSHSHVCCNLASHLLLMVFEDYSIKAEQVGTGRQGPPLWPGAPCLPGQEGMGLRRAGRPHVQGCPCVHEHTSPLHGGSDAREAVGAAPDPWQWAALAASGAEPQMPQGPCFTLLSGWTQQDREKSAPLGI